MRRKVVTIVCAYCGTEYNLSDYRKACDNCGAPTPWTKDLKFRDMRRLRTESPGEREVNPI